jgi:endonuclease/exonuclease/phosphatase family metal-dependent hydrolase
VGTGAGAGIASLRAARHRPAAGPPGRPLAVVSYNVHRCIGVDGRHDPGRVARVVRELDADVVGLQEVASRHRGDGDVDQLAYLAADLGLGAVAGPVVDLERGRCGNGLLTRLPVLDVRRIDLTLARREPRGALDVDLAWGGTALRVVVTHLGLRPGDRRAQVARLLAALGDDREQPLVLLGDVNEWFPAAAALRRLHARLGRPPAVPSFPSRRPLFALDRLWVQPLTGLAGLRAHRSPLARLASDHLPVRATLEGLALAAETG